MTKEQALWDLMDAARETKRSAEAGSLDLSERKRAWRQAYEQARICGATTQERKQAEEEGGA